MRVFFLLSTLVMLLLTCPAAFGQSLVEEPIDHDEPCFWEDDMCFSYQSAGPSQPTILTCTSNQGCKKCIQDDATGKMVCGTAFMENGDCRCTVDAADPKQPNVSGCTLEGSCTYKK